MGRTLRALRGSEVAAQSIGISPARARITAFAVSAFIAGLGGALLAMHQENVNYGSNFAPFAALFWLVLVVTLGSRTVEGAARPAPAFALFDAVLLKGAVFGWMLRSPDRIPDFLPLSPKWRFILFGLARSSSPATPRAWSSTASGGPAHRADPGPGADRRHGDRPPPAPARAVDARRGDRRMTAARPGGHRHPQVVRRHRGPRRRDLTEVERASGSA